MPTLHTPTDGASYVLYEGSGDWSALYERETGRLVHSGDHYAVIETLLANLKVEQVQSDAFMRGGGGHEDVARTLEDLQAYEHGERLRDDRYNELIERAGALQREAEELLKAPVQPVSLVKHP